MLILTGFMATGKSAAGAIVSRRLGWPLIDTDAEIVKRAGKTIARIFTEDGEARFRALEREVIDEVAGSATRCDRCGRPSHRVLATGGGALIDPHSRARLKEAGIIVCLSARPEVIATRIGSSAMSRPKLTEGGKPLLSRISDLMEQRSAVYRFADVTLDTSNLTLEEVADRVLEAFARRESYRCKASA